MSDMDVKSSRLRCPAPGEDEEDDEGCEGGCDGGCGHLGDGIDHDAIDEFQRAYTTREEARHEAHLASLRSLPGATAAALLGVDLWKCHGCPSLSESERASACWYWIANDNDGRIRVWGCSLACITRVVQERNEELDRIVEPDESPESWDSSL